MVSSFLDFGVYEGIEKNGKLSHPAFRILGVLPHVINSNARSGR